MPPFKKVLLILAVLSCTFAAVWRFWISEYLLRLPNDFTYEAELISVNNFYDQTKQVYLGQESSSTFFSYETIENTKVGMVIENRFQVVSGTGQEIINIQRTYGINPQTGAHVLGLGDKDREGYLFAPRYLEPGEGFTYWHINYDGPAKMNYVKRENILGLEVYLYETHYENVNIDQTEQLDYLEGVPEQWGILLEPYLKIWVEPTTGFLVNYEDETTAYYYDIQSGEKLSPWNHFSNTFSEESVKEKIAEARTEKWQIVLFELIIPIASLALAGLLVLLAISKRVSRTEHNFGIHWPIHAFFILFPIILIMVCWKLAEGTINKGNELAFQNRIISIEDIILRRSDLIIHTLEGIQGLFQASDNVSREEWSVYIQQLDLEKNYPGIKVVGYAPVVWQADLESHVASLKAEGFEDYAIDPEGVRDIYTPVIYVEPASERNLSLLGSDPYSDELRNEAMTFARDTGEAGMTSKLIFGSRATEGDSKTGVATVIYAPVYKKATSIGSIDEKRSAIEGYAFAAFWVDEFIEGLFEGTPLGVDFTIYDGTETSEEAILYEYLDDPNSSTETNSFRSKTESIQIGGRSWTLKFEGLEEFRASSSEKWLTWGLLWLSMLLCLLHIFIYFTLVSSRNRAMEWISERSSRFSFKGSKRNTRKERMKR